MPKRLLAQTHGDVCACHSFILLHRRSRFAPSHARQHTLLQLISVITFCVVEPLLHFSPVVKWAQIWFINHKYEFVVRRLQYATNQRCITLCESKRRNGRFNMINKMWWDWNCENATLKSWVCSRYRCLRNCSWLWASVMTVGCSTETGRQLNKPVFQDSCEYELKLPPLSLWNVGVVLPYSSWNWPGWQDTEGSNDGRPGAW